MKMLKLEHIEKEIDLLENWLDNLLDSEIEKATRFQLEVMRSHLRAEAMEIPQDTTEAWWRRDTQTAEPTMMRRLTFEGNFCDISMCTGFECNMPCDQRKVWERLKAIEDILGPNYDLTHVKNQLERSRPFCLECGKKVEFRVEAGFRNMEAHGVKFSFREETAYCAECAHEVYVPEIEDANVDVRRKAYGKARREREKTKRRQRPAAYRGGGL